jgi:hypothetical protein
MAPALATNLPALQALIFHLHRNLIIVIEKQKE